jgi:hypothetical protein
VSFLPTSMGHRDQGFVLEAPAKVRVVHHGINLCEAVPALTEALASVV